MSALFLRKAQFTQIDLSLDFRCFYPERKTELDFLFEAFFGAAEPGWRQMG